MGPTNYNPDSLLSDSDRGELVVIICSGHSPAWLKRNPLWGCFLTFGGNLPLPGTSSHIHDFMLRTTCISSECGSIGDILQFPTKFASPRSLPTPMLVVSCWRPLVPLHHVAERLRETSFGPGQDSNYRESRGHRRLFSAFLFLLGLVQSRAPPPPGPWGQGAGRAVGSRQPRK